MDPEGGGGVGGSGQYLGQLDRQSHGEAPYPNLHGQHVIVARGAPRAMGHSTCEHRIEMWMVAKYGRGHPLETAWGNKLQSTQGWFQSSNWGCEVC